MIDSAASVIIQHWNWAMQKRKKSKLNAVDHTINNVRRRPDALFFVAKNKIMHQSLSITSLQLWIWPFLLLNTSISVQSLLQHFLSAFRLQLSGAALMLHLNTFFFCCSNPLPTFYVLINFKSSRVLIINISSTFVSLSYDNLQIFFQFPISRYFICLRYEVELSTMNISTPYV